MFLSSKLKIDIKNIIKNIKEDDTENVEIELRFRNSNNDIDGVVEFLESQNYEKSEKFTIDYISKSVNKLRITQEDDKFYKTTKRDIMNKFIEMGEISLKLSVSGELREKIEEKPAILNEMIRKKNRITYTKNNLQVDITKVKEDNIERIELEIEVIDAKKFVFEDFDELAKEIYNIVSVSKTEIIEILTKALGKKTNDMRLIYHLMSKPRDLEIADLTNDGILKPFAISLKADGVQKFMVLYSNGVFLVDSKNDLIKISSEKHLKYSIYVGEYLEDKKLYLPFDTIMFENNIVKDKDYLTRYSYCKNIIVKSYVIEKPIYTYKNTVESFNQTIIDVFKTADESKFFIDGLIFTPIESPYVADGQYKNKRVLSKHYDVCKYKKEDDLTIDFLVKDNYLWSHDSRSRDDLSKAVFMTSENVDKQTFKDAKWKNKIVEFKPVVDGDNSIIYTPIRIREDKSHPNPLHVAEKLFKLRKDPILKETLEGKSLQLMRRYHNEIKKRLIVNQTGYVIDIGGGHGGDINKYEKNEKIIKVFSIEPQENFIEEYKRRIKLYKSNKYLIIKGGGEETEKIIKESSKYFGNTHSENININFMISLSFFWKNRKMLESLANTIKRIKEHYSSSKILINFLTIEGNNLEQLFETKKTDIIKLNNVTMIRKDKNKIYVDIADSKTVHDQEEYLVKLNELWELTKFYPRFLESALGGAKNDYILSVNEITYTSLFVYGTAIYDPSSLDKVNSLFVDETQGTKHEKNGVMAVGDDEIEILQHFKNKKLYRIATLKKFGSLYHSLLKLLNSSYRDGSVHTRIKMARDLSSKLDNDIEKIATKINRGIMIIEGAYKIRKFNSSAEKWIILFYTKDGEYEPVVYYDKNSYQYTFENSSDLIVNT